MCNLAGVDELVFALASPGLEGLARDVLFSLEHPALEPFRVLWPPPAPAGTPTAPLAPASLPVLGWLGRLTTARHEFATPLVQALCMAAPSLRWRQSYSVADIDAAFLRNYGYTEIVGPAAPRRSQRLSCGFLLLGPHTLYPRHHHEAEEIYVSLRGEAGWLQGDAIWRQRPPGTVVHHCAGEIHAMRTTVDPLLALYLWRGANLNKTAHLDTA